MSHNKRTHNKQEPEWHMTDWDKMLAEQARINADIRALQKQMGITPRTLEQRAADWDRKQAEIARARAATAPRFNFPKI